jgi:oxygen-independent coproporphyrinogen-3 oxidase
VLRESGFEQYEVSGYARAGFRCEHNLNYWNFGDYLGIGAGAHGKLTDASRGLIVRTQQWREPRRYLAAESGPLSRTPIEVTDRAFEFAMNGLRLSAGFQGSLFVERTGLPEATLTRALTPALERGLVLHDAGQWRASAKGFRFLNEILVDLLPG